MDMDIEFNMQSRRNRRGLVLGIVTIYPIVHIDWFVNDTGELPTLIEQT
jgi:hypothetical protein